MPEVEDVAGIVRLYADDDMGSSREVVSDPPADEYVQAFKQIDSDPKQRLVVVEDGGELVATLQLSFLQHLVLRGGERAQIEAVRVRSDRRGGGLGEAVFQWAIDEARHWGCRLVQLTTNAFAGLLLGTLRSGAYLWRRHRLLRRGSSTTE